MKKIKHLVVLAMFLLIMTPMLAMAQTGDVDPWGGKESDIQSTIGLGDKDPRDIAASVINVALGFLGIVAVIIILLGGFKWMTAMGNDDKVGEAKKLIIAGVIGLVIILAAFGIATFVINNLLTATTE
ncbi:hypothetical protein HY798_00440 [Candidatus Falkowbacteria bacterium]|nr:hypothetical protein [Candidatus Falkowbacteria bacterium]